MTDAVTNVPMQDRGDDPENYITRHEDGTATVLLRRPVTVATRDSSGATGEELLTEIYCRRLTGRHLREASSKPTAAAAGYLLQSSTGKSLPILDRLDAEDHQRISDVIMGFIKIVRPTG
jgi:hypothetical protein